jgi:hypothetical protein
VNLRINQAEDDNRSSRSRSAKRHHSRQNQKAALRPKNDTTDTYHSALSPCVPGAVVVPVSDTLSASLNVAGYGHWCSRVRLGGLVALLANVQKKSAGKAHQNVKLPLSNRLVRGYISPYRKHVAGCHREAVPVLVEIGWLELVEKAHVGFHEKKSACYRPGPHFPPVKIPAITAETTPCIARKVENSIQRREAGLNRRFPFREPLLADLRKLTIPASAHATVEGLLNDKDYQPSTQRTVAAVKARNHTVTVKPSGLTVTSMLSCPRPLKPLLHLAGEPVALCDISSAHWTFLPRLVADRIAFRRKRGHTGDDEISLAPLVAEYERLIKVMSKGSFYRLFCRDDATEAEVKARKKLLNVLLNSKNHRSKNNKLWKWVRSKFPLCIGIIEAIKRENHRNIGRQLQHFTAKAIEAALLDMQRQGLPAFPDTDSLIVRECDRVAACHAIGKAMYEETRGVRVTVGGMRFNTSLTVG